MSPPANSFLDKPIEVPQEEFPLRVCFCERCGSIQLKDTVNPEILFKNYLYESSTSASFRKHFEDYAKYIVETFKTTENDFVVEIGSNDNCLLKPLKELGVWGVGVEPATNIVEKHKDDGIKVYNEFFNVEVAKKIKEEQGTAKAIVCNNCLAHIENINSVIEGVKILLEDGGIFIFENAHLLTTINNMDLGQFYHEHIFYHSLRPLKTFFIKHGMEIFHVEQNQIQGGSIRCFVRKAYGQYMNWSSVENIIALEDESKLYNKETYQQFERNIKNKGEQLVSLLKDLKIQNKKIICYSFPAKMTTMFAYWKFSSFLDYVVDDATAKQNKWTPIGNLPIFDKSRLNEADCVVLGSWNYNSEIISNNSSFKGQWIKILPNPETYNEYSIL